MIKTLQEQKQKYVHPVDTFKLSNSQNTDSGFFIFTESDVLH